MRIDVLPGIVRPQTADYATVRGLCTALCGRFTCLRPTAVGVSVLGRELPAMVLTPPGGGGMHPGRVLIAAAFHGQEWLTSLIALRLCEEMCVALRTGERLCDLPLADALQGRQVWFLPMINPDGADIAIHGSTAAGERAGFVATRGGDKPGLWQANARGVDINHNFNAGWDEMQALTEKSGKNRPGARQYPGKSPESEPETRALTDLCRRLAFRHVVALHSQGEEIYWSFGEDTPPQSAIIARVLGAASGYKVAEPTGLASYGGFKDWFIRCFHRPGFTVELGKGENPLPVGDFEAIYEKAREMLVLSTVL